MGNIGNICFKKDNPININKCKYKIVMNIIMKKCRYYHDNIIEILQIIAGII